MNMMRAISFSALKSNIIDEAPVRQESVTSDVSIDPILFDLVNFRMAQIRESAEGVEKHWIDLQERGVSTEKLDQAHIWRESSFFSAKEKAALMLTEAISLNPSKRFLNQLLGKVRCFFRREELISLLLAIMAANNANSPCYAPREVAAEETAPARPADPPKPYETKRLPRVWLKSAHQLAENGIIVK
jgi:alkylhydroperoxidase family enzyme